MSEKKTIALKDRFLKTRTLCDRTGDEPLAVICFGHVTPEVFNKAFKNEGWSEEGDYSLEDIKFRYMKENYETTKCEFSDTPKDGYVPVSFASWD